MSTLANLWHHAISLQAPPSSARRTQAVNQAVAELAEMTGPPPALKPELLKQLTICIPAYNEAAVIADTLKTLCREAAGAEILVVDDGSTDGTAAAAKAVPGVRVISHGRNIGYGASLKTAMRHAARPVVVWCDGDGQHRTQDLLRVIAPVLAGEKDVVIGVRMAGSDVRPRRRPGKWVLKTVAEMVARGSVPDLNCGLRCFRREVITQYLHLLPDGFSASSTSTLLMMKRGYRVGYQPITAQRRTGSPSTVRMFRDGWRTLHLMVRILILFDAFALFSLLATLQVGAGLAYGLGTMLRVGYGFPVAAAVVVISGMLTFFMGLICDQIVALRVERFEAFSLSPVEMAP
jgi:glycosyltransferase involved in cell wall biosynthesis